MRTIHGLHKVIIERETVLTIGAFDGLHLGHQELLRRLGRRARQTERLSAVVTFDPLPRAVLHPADDVLCLTTAEEKIELLQQWGLDVLVILPFTMELARTSAEDFLGTLYTHLKMRELWVGWDFALGRGRQGTVPNLKKLGSAMGFAMHVVAPVRDGDVLISSTHIRKLLDTGHVRKAAEMLGRYYSLRARVVDEPVQRQEEGLTSVGLRMAQRCVVPSQGAYAAYATIGDRRCPAMAIIHPRSNPEDPDREGELYLLDCQAGIPSEGIMVRFVKRLRDERRSAGAPRAHLQRDAARAREILT